MDTVRYSRLVHLPGFGLEGLSRMSSARVVLLGCGTLGCIYALNLVRMGVAQLTIIDRDIVEESNLASQILFDEEDARQILPKAVAAQRHLEKMNSNCRIQAFVRDFHPGNAEELLSGADLICDATDNFDARFLLNDIAVKRSIPWIYTAVVGYTGLMKAVLPGKNACLRCFLDDPPAPGSLPTCETDGVWLAAAQSIVSLGCSEVLRILLGKEVDGGLFEVDHGKMVQRRLEVARRSDCPTCQQREFDFLQKKRDLQADKQCGRDMVHLSPQRGTNLNLSALREKLKDSFECKLTDYLLHLKSAELEIYLFADGRAFIKGVADPGRARSLYHRYVGA
jgi:adenylyltransferase/sulfurtransferase